VLPNIIRERDRIMDENAHEALELTKEELALIVSAVRMAATKVNIELEQLFRELPDGATPHFVASLFGYLLYQRQDRLVSAGMAMGLMPEDLERRIRESAGGDLPESFRLTTPATVLGDPETARDENERLN